MTSYKGFWFPFTYLALLFIIFSTTNSFCQNIRKHTDSIQIAKLQKIVRELDEAYVKRVSDIKTIASKHRWELKKNISDSRYITLDHIDKFGLPVYLTSFNIHSATTIGTNKVKAGGELKLTLTGQGVTIGQWDQGVPFVSHDYLKNQVTLGETSDTTGHATHVAGTLVGDGTNDQYNGMASGANLIAYDWEGAEGEMLFEVLNGMILSNHSYGTASGWLFNRSEDKWQWMGFSGHDEDFKFGYYSQMSQRFDYVAFSSPTHLIVVSAGNDRIEKGPAQGESYLDVEGNDATAPKEADGGEDGYDCIPSSSTAKNVLTVGAVKDIREGYSSSNDVVMTDFSSWGPTDDGRIKPDIVANGFQIWSSYYDPSRAEETNLVAKISGTSFSAPSVTGSLALVQEHYKNLFGNYMLAATLKALVIHTADESGPAPGPDYKFGWGLMNTATAAQAITNASNEGQIKLFESSLLEGNSFEFQFTHNDSDDLIATLSWTDPPAQPLTNNLLNNRQKRLINDLDLRIISVDDQKTYFPFILDPSNPNAPATRGDNILDNVEKIFLPDLPSGQYIVQVSHKGELKDITQSFSLILSGIYPSQPISESDREELIKIYNSTNGSEWNRPWDLEQPASSWEGVVFSKEGRVISLDLVGNNLSEVFPSVDLPFLRSLNCSENQLYSMRDPINLESLTNLSVHTNKLDFNDLTSITTYADTISYSPQDSIGSMSAISLKSGENLTLELPETFQVNKSVYTWYKAEQQIASGASPSINITNISPADSGIYYCKITHPDVPGLTLTHKPFVVRVSAPECILAAEVEFTDANCGKNNGAITLTIQNSTQTASVLWSSGDTTTNINQLAPGLYSVEITDQNGCRLTKSQEIQSSPQPEITIEAKEGAACGKNDGIASIAVSGGTPPFDILWETGQKTRIANNLPPGDHTVTVTDVNNCLVEAVVSIDELSGPVISEINQEDAVCGQANGKASISISDGTPPYNVSWDHGPETSSLENLSKGIYHVTVADQRGCSVRDSIILENTGSPVVEVLDQTLATCSKANGGAILTVSDGTPPYSIEWPDGQTGTQATGLNEGSYIVSVTDSSGCVSLSEVLIQGSDSVQMNLVAVSDATCEKENGSAIINVEGGSSGLTVDWSNGMTGETVGQLAPGTYFVWANDSSGCADTLSFTISNQGAEPIAEFNTTIEGTKATFDNQSQSASFYRWDFGNGMWSILEHPIMNFEEPGSYDIRLIAASENCGADTITKTITINNVSTSIHILDESLVNIYPSPADQVLYIDFTTNLTPTKLRIVNSLGESILEHSNISPTKQHFNIPVQNLSSGIYFLKLTTLQGNGYYKFYKK